MLIETLEIIRFLWALISKRCEIFLIAVCIVCIQIQSSLDSQEQSTSRVTYATQEYEFSIKLWS